MTDRDQNILRRYQAGAKIKDIAAEVGMAANSVGQVLKRLGVERPSKPQKRWQGRDDQTEQIIALWKHGLCVGQIAERTRNSEEVVGRILSEAGLRSMANPRHRYDGIGGIGRGRSNGRQALQRVARRA